MTFRTSLADFLETPGQGVRLLLSALLFESILIGLLYVPIPPNPDQELYDYMAWSALSHGGLYRCATDVNLPGEPLLHIVSMSVFGNQYWSYRMQDYLLLVGFSAAVGLLTQRYYGALFACLFYGMYLVIYTMSGCWMSGQRDVVATHAIILAGLAYLRRSEGGHAGWLVITGAAAAAAMLLKPTYAAFAPLLLLLVQVFVWQPVRAVLADALVCTIVGACCLGSVVLLGWVTDSLRACYETVVIFSSQNYMGGIGFLEICQRMVNYCTKCWHWYILMAVSGTVCWAFEMQRAPLSVIIATLGTILVSTFVQRKGFEYHYGGLLTLLTLFCAFFLAELVRNSRRIDNLRHRCAVLSLPVLIVSAGLMSKACKEYCPQVAWYLDRSRFNEMLKSRGFKDVFETSRYVRETTRPGQSVWPFTTHAMISSLADRPIPTPLIHPAFLRAEKATPLSSRWQRDIKQVFMDRAPEVIVLEAAPDGRPSGYCFMDHIRPIEPIAAFKEAFDRLYVADRRIGRFDCFRKNRGRSTTPPELGGCVTGIAKVTARKLKQ